MDPSRLTVFVISTGEPSSADCLSIARREARGARVVEIRNVAPMSAAFQQMLDRCETPVFVQLDADMLLRHGRLERLVDDLEAQPPEVAIWADWLWGDAEERAILGVKAYRHEVCRRFPYRDTFSCEVDQLARMTAEGYRVGYKDPPPERPEDCAGEHRVLQTPEMAFRRWKRLMQKHRRYEHMSWLAPYPRRLKERWLKNPDNAILEGAYLGALAGLTGELPPDREADFRLPDQDYRRAAVYVGELSRGPKELTLYVTDRCNMRCEFDGVPCMREAADEPGAGVPHNGTMEVAHVERILDLNPQGFYSCCIAGFGEPLLVPHLPEIVAALHRRKVLVGIVTNGALLERRVADFPREHVFSFSVSVNAGSAEEHEAMSKTKTWEKVLAGIRAARDAGHNVGCSFVLTKELLDRAPQYLEVAGRAGARFVHFHNVLPHAGSMAVPFRMGVLRADDPEVVARLEELRRLPGADLVMTWPKLVDFSRPPPMRCTSPLRMLGVDASGLVTVCRRVDPPKPGNPNVEVPNLWHESRHVVPLRLAVLGDRPTPDACLGCFGAYHD